MKRPQRILAVVLVILPVTAPFLIHHHHGSSAPCRSRRRTSHPAQQQQRQSEADDDEVDVIVIGAGLGGLSAGAILNTVHEKQVAVYESHYLPGGCAHAFDRQAKNGKTFTFDSGPTILLGCSRQPFSALRQVLDAVQQNVTWIRYDGWGMIEHPKDIKKEKRWKCELGTDLFQRGPLTTFSTSGDKAVAEFEALRAACQPLITGQQIPTMAMRPGPSALIPLLRYFPTLVQLIKQGDLLTGTFAPYMDGPEFVVTNSWLRDWLDALAFSLSGLPASRTAAAAMAFVLDDMHRDGAALDYPQGGLGTVVDALVRGVEQGSHNSKLHLRSHVERIIFTEDGKRATGVTLRSGQTIRAREGVICNAPVWSLKGLIDQENVLAKLENSKQADSTSRRTLPKQSWTNSSPHGWKIQPREKEEDSSTTESFLVKCDTTEMTGSFLHLHVAINAEGLDLASMEAHYTVMDRGLSGDVDRLRESFKDRPKATQDGPCGELNMIAVSNPCVIDPTLAPKGHMVLHAYGAGNEPFDIWENKKGEEYLKLKEERSQVLWRALESVIPDIRDRVVLDLVGSPLTHERFLRRPRGTYGAATEDYFPDGSTPVSNLVVAGDSIFPGIGIPAVAISGASAANAFVSPLQQWKCLDDLAEAK